MKKSAFIPDYYLLSYNKESERKTYVQFKIIFAEKKLLTNLIRIEKNNGYNKIKDAQRLLRIRNKNNWQKCNLTGLRETFVKNFYYADVFIDGVKSLSVVKLSENFDEVHIRICRKFYPENNPHYRAEIVKHIISNWYDAPKPKTTNTQLDEVGQLTLF